MMPEAKARQTIAREVKADTNRKRSQLLQQATVSQAFKANHQHGDHSS
jgi:hypothetical protein